MSTDAARPPRCLLPPPGWECTRHPHHPGPCAARRVTWTARFWVAVMDLGFWVERSTGWNMIWLWSRAVDRGNAAARASKPIDVTFVPPPPREFVVTRDHADGTQTVTRYRDGRKVWP